ncbi:hypothetical protein R1sor_009166 [Riccia sorocarpa]|uniref:Uncharacterized protein n=1 Tax=Riccia sorocarpa TaxID=122646 RepID=A0ABD3H7U4_9MARC
MGVQGSRYLKMVELEDEEFQLFQIDADGGNKTFLSPIMIPFCRILALEYDRRFEKANKVKGGEIIVVKCEDRQGKRPRLELVTDVPSSMMHLVTEDSLNTTAQISDVVDWDGSDELLDYELGDDFNADLFDAIDEAEGRASGQLANTTILKTTDRNVAPEAGGPIRIWSKLLFDDLLAAWERGERTARAKLKIEVKKTIGGGLKHGMKGMRPSAKSGVASASVGGEMASRRNMLLHLAISSGNMQLLIHT